jgi:Conotoxin
LPQFTFSQKYINGPEKSTLQLPTTMKIRLGLLFFLTLVAATTAADLGRVENEVKTTLPHVHMRGASGVKEKDEQQQCHAQGGYCKIDEQCCEALECIGFACVDDNKTCRVEGVRCQQDFQCCAGMDCVGYMCRQHPDCLYEGTTCIQDFDCCGTLECVNSTCTPQEVCHREGEACLEDYECCGFLECNGFKW